MLEVKPFKKFKVLIVEDEQDYAEILHQALDAKTFEVLEITNSASRAFTVIEEKSPDFLILDLQLAMGDGIGLLVRIDEDDQKLKKKPYMVVVTNFEDGDIFYAAHELSSYVFKKADTDTPAAINFHLKGISKTLGKETHYVPLKTNAQTKLSDQDIEDYRERLLRKTIEKELDRFYMGHELDGRAYLARVLFHVIDIPNHQKIIMNHIYADLCTEDGTNELSAYDNAIRRLLEKTFLKLDQEKLDEIYRIYDKVSRGEVPTTRSFVLNLAQKIKQDMDLD